ncbi:MAG TPA: protein kinase [Bacteroidota bacterium]|nr:protein kinase [Bacteroidota bacterium]
MTGQTISHYKILEKLGEGGMGVVYKAEDTKLDRILALKFLPEHLNASEQDKQRFIQEAKAAAALNHPNVCSIIDIQDHDGQMFIVMEYVDGQTLRDLGATTLKQAIDIGIQIADGLAAAHDKGIVHRDIKPENIMVRKDGIAQIMDFGLAKLRTASSKINRLTKEGSTVGTAGYMSPEQVLGQDADHRSDIFSFGVLLYEMFTGQLPFRGVHETALAYEIVNVDAAPMSTVKLGLDPNLDAIVLDCIEKDPKERCQSVAEVARDLRRVKRESTRQRHSRITAARPVVNPSAVLQSPELLTEAATHGTTGSSRLPWILCGLFLLVAAGAVAFHFLTLPKPGEKQVMRSLILPPPGNIYDVTWGGHIAISPDGKTIAFAAIDTVGVNHIWVRPVHSLTAIELSGTDEGKYPFWSPDNKKIAFFARNKLKNIDATGGPVLTICDASDGRGGSWNHSGVILFSPGPTEPISKVAAAGGIPIQITKFDTIRHESSHRWPVFLPDGNHFLYSTLTALGTSTDNDVVRISALDSSVNKVLFNASTNIAFSNGYLFFIRQGTLMVQQFDLQKLDVAGDAVPVAERIILSPPYARGSFSVSNTGILILQSGENQIQHTALFDMAGTRTRIVADMNASGPRFSFDGKRVAFHIMDPFSRNGDVWINELSRGASSRLTFHPAVDIIPIWSPRGDSIIFQSNRSGVYDIYIKGVNGTGDEQLLVQSNRNKQGSDWSLDGKYFTYNSVGDPKSKNDLWILPMFGDRKPIPFLQTEFNEVNGSFSPDSRWIVYASDETGSSEIYARLVDGSGGKIKISTNGGRRPFWRSDPRKIFFSSLDRKLQVAYVSAGPSTITVDSIRTLWDYESRNLSGNTITDISSDGTLATAVVTDVKQISAPITLVVNWDEEVKKK